MYSLQLLSGGQTFMGTDGQQVKNDASCLYRLIDRLIDWWVCWLVHVIDWLIDWPTFSSQSSISSLEELHSSLFKRLTDSLFSRKEGMEVCIFYCIFIFIFLGRPRYMSLVTGEKTFFLQLNRFFNSPGEREVQAPPRRPKSRRTNRSTWTPSSTIGSWNADRPEPSWKPKASYPKTARYDESGQVHQKLTLRKRNMGFGMCNGRGMFFAEIPPRIAPQTRGEAGARRRWTVLVGRCGDRVSLN